MVDSKASKLCRRGHQGAAVQQHLWGLCVIPETALVPTPNFPRKAEFHLAATGFKGV